MVAAALLLAAALVDPLYGTRLPPPEYDHEPIIPVVIVYLSLPELDATCRALDARDMDGRSWGCSLKLAIQGQGVTGFRCLVFLPRYVPQSFVATQYRHERAHCNDWPADHPYPTS